MAWGQSGLLLAALAANGQFHRTCDRAADFHSKRTQPGLNLFSPIIYYFPWQEKGYQIIMNVRKLSVMRDQQKFTTPYFARYFSERMSQVATCE